MSRPQPRGSGKPAPLEHAERQARTLARFVTKYTPQGWGFIVCLAQFGEGGDMTYVSDSERPTVIKLLRELAGKLEGKGDPLDVKLEFDPVISETLELLSVVGHVLNCPGVQINVHAAQLGDGPDGGEAGKELAEKLTVDFAEALNKALSRAEELIKKHRPELLNLGQVVPDGVPPDVDGPRDEPET